MDDDDASPRSLEYVSAYDQEGLDHTWLSELSEEWISNGTGEPSEQGSARGMSLRGAFGTPRKIDTIPEDPETSTVRIVLAETDVHNTPEWKRHLEEAKGPKNLFTPCQLETIFREDTIRSQTSTFRPESPEFRHSTMKQTLTNKTDFLDEITDSSFLISSRKPHQSPLREAFKPEITSPDALNNQRPTTGSTSSSGKSTTSSHAKSTHESSDDDTSLGDPNEDLSIAEPTHTLMDPLSFSTACPTQNQSSVDTPPNNSADESFRTAKVVQTPYPNPSNSLASSTEAKSRSVRFAPPDDHTEQSFAFDFTPERESPDRPHTPTAQISTKAATHSSPFKLFSRYDTFTNNKMEDMVANLLPKSDEDDDFTRSREHKRAKREALARDRVHRLPQNQEIRHVRVPSLTTQEMFDDAEDFMRDLRSMPPRIPETGPEKADESAGIEDENEEDDREPVVDEEEEFQKSTVEDGDTSENEEYSQNQIDYSQLSESEAFQSNAEAQSPGKLSASFLSPGRALRLARLPSTNPTSRVSSAESMQVIHPQDVAHILPTTFGSMMFDKTQNTWVRIRPSQTVRRKSGDDNLPPEDENNELVPEDEEEDIFRDIDDLIVSDEEEVSHLGSRPSSSGKVFDSGNNTSTHPWKDDTTNRVATGKTSPGVKNIGGKHEHVEQKPQHPEVEELPSLIISDAQTSPAPPLKSPQRKSLGYPPLPLSSSPVTSNHYLPSSPLRNPLQQSSRQANIPSPSPVRSPTRSLHHKPHLTDKRMRKSIPLPPLDTPEAIRQTQQRLATPKADQPIRRPELERVMGGPKSKRPAQEDSPFLDPRETQRLSISPISSDSLSSDTPRQDISFSVTTRSLVKHLTDFEPFEPYWEKLLYVNFRGKDVTSLNGIKSFCPKLQEIDIRDCKVKYLNGLPSSMRVLKANGNMLSGLVSFAWGKNIQYLDLANNEIDDLSGLSCLIHLRELRVDCNLLTSLEGILQLDGLLKVSAKQNQISHLDFTDARLPRIEVLECQKNCIGWIEGLEGLTSLMSLHLDDNNITVIQSKQPLHSLRTLKLCHNELEVFDGKLCPELRTLYLDENKIHSFSGIKKLRLLENFSARSQHGKANIGIHGLCELRKVYLSGNVIPLRLDRPFYNLQYLELAAIKLSALPSDFASKVPNVRILNLSFNSLKDITSIRGMTLLKRLFLIGNRISNLSEGTADTFLSLRELQVLDLRLNPITLPFYPPVEAKKSDHHKDMFSLVTGRQAQSTWQQRDKAFRNSMPRSSELRRKAYQGLIYTACPKLRWFDGSEVSRGSVVEGERVLKTLETAVDNVRIARQEAKN